MSKVCIFLADGFEEIEGLMVVDLLRRATIEITMVSIMNSLNVVGSHNISVLADMLFDDMNFEDADMLVLPGGMPGTKKLGSHNGLVNLLKEFNDNNKKISAICAAPSVLGMNNILKNKRATCFPGFEPQLIGAITCEDRVVKDGNIITSKGLGTALEFSLEIINELKGEAESLRIKDSVQF